MGHIKYPEYDSPFELTLSDITTQMARNIDEMCWQTLQRVGINGDKEKLLAALRQDAERYREAFSKGRDTGYAERDEKIVRCKDCKYCKYPQAEKEWCEKGHLYRNGEIWFCADGERRTSDA